MAFVNAKTGKQIKLEKGYLSNPVDYQTFLKQQEAKRQSAAPAPAAATAQKAKGTASRMNRAEGSPSAAFSKGAASPAAARNRVEGLPSARPSVVSLENQKRQAQVDQDTDAILRLNKQLKEERARNPSARGYSLGRGIADVFKKGANQVAQTGADTLALAEDIVNAPFELFSGMELGSLRNSGEGIFNPLRKKVQEEGTVLAEKSAENVRKGGKGAALLDKYGTATVAAVPQSIIAMLTGGTSTAAQAAAQTTGGVARAAATELSPGIARTIQNAVGNLARDPQFWSSFSQVVGSGYEQALEDGASAPKAALYAVGNGLMNAAVEVGGGIQTLPGELQAGASGWRALVDSALDEGKEEVIQGVIERAMQNLSYQKGNPLASVKNPDAVFNPKTAVEEFAGGAVVGGILSGGQIAANRVLSGADAHVRRTLDMMNRAAGRETAPGSAQEATGARFEDGQGTDTTPAQSAAQAAQIGPENIFIKTAADARAEGDRKVRGTLELMQRAAGMETGTAQQETAHGTGTEPVRAGRVTAIQRPYQGTTPVQAQKNTAPVQVAADSVQRAQNRIEGARALAESPMSAGQGFKSILKRSLQNVFHSAKGVEVEGVTFEGQPYKVNVGNKVLGKVLGDKNLSAEKVALLDILPEIIRNGEYVGSGEYVAHGSKSRPVSRYDYFETPVTINGQRYIAKFDVEALPDVNNYRTHQIVKIDLTPTEGSLVGPEPTAASGGSGPVEGTSSPNVDSTIPQPSDSVKPSGGDGLGAADAGSLNSNYDRLQAQSSTFHPEGPNAARPVDVPTQDFDGRNISKSASTMMGAEILDDADVVRLEQLTADGGFSFDTIHDKDALQRAQDTVRTIGFDGALERYKQAAQSNTATKDNAVLGQVLMLEAARGGNRNALAEIAALYARNSTNIAQAMQAQSILRQLGPEARLYALQKSVNELAEKYQTDIKLDQTALDDFVNAENEEARQTAEARLIQSAASQLPTSFRAKYDAVRYLAMLGNPRTHIRNILGNVFFQIPATVKNRVGSLGEVTARALGADVERTKSLTGANPFGALAREARGDWANAKPFLEGGKYSEGRTTAGAIEREAKPFQNSGALGKAVGWAADKNGALLEAEDNLAKRWIYSQSLAGYLKANGVKSISEASPDLLSRARNYAAQEALRNTFNDKNSFSDAVAELGGLRNSSNPWLQRFSYLTEGLLPFKRTPANVLARAVEYNPVGSILDIRNAFRDAKAGKMDQETFLKHLDRQAAALSGTALMALGALVSGSITGGEDEDEDQRNFDDLTGHQNYALELDNGTSITLDWLAPEAIPFFMGVELAHAAQDGGLSLEDFWTAVKNMGEPMLEMSMLQGLNDVFENAAYAQQHGGSVMGSAVVSAASGYLTQVFPTLLGQLERTTEDRRMTTYSDKNDRFSKDLQFFLGKVSQKVPGWDYHQIPYLDAWGREEETGDALQRAFNNMLNPAYVSQVRVNKVEKELQRVKDATGDGGVFPDRAPRYFTVDGQRKDLTAEEYVKYAKKVGQTQFSLLEKLMEQPGYQRMDDTQREKAVAAVYEYASGVGKMEVSGWNPDSSSIVKGALESPLPTETYILYRVFADRDGNGSVSGAESAQTLMELDDLTDKQRGEAWSVFNDVNEAKNPFTGALSKKLDPEEALTAWDIYGRKGTKEEPYTQERKKKDLQQELGLSYIDAAQMYELMKRAVKG